MQFTISLLNLNWFKLARVCQTLQKLAIKDLHLDIMDGHFSPTISFGAEISKQIKTTYPKFQLSGHFMVKLPSNKDWTTYLSPFMHLDSFIFHYEALKAAQIKTLFKWAKTNQKQVGLAISTSTAWTALKSYLPFLDYLLIMLVPLGKGGQKMEQAALFKLQDCLKYLQTQHLKVQVIADGGINFDTISACPLTLDYAVLGSYCWKGRSVAKQLTKIRQKLNLLK